MGTDYYKLLGIDKNATEEEIKKSMPSTARLMVDDPSMIGGSASAEVKQQVFDVLRGWSQEGIFGAHITRTISLQKIDVEKLGKKVKPVVVGEVPVSQGTILDPQSQS